MHGETIRRSFVFRERGHADAEGLHFELGKIEFSWLKPSTAPSARLASWCVTISSSNNRLQLAGWMQRILLTRFLRLPLFLTSRFAITFCRFQYYENRYLTYGSVGIRSYIRVLGSRMYWVRYAWVSAIVFDTPTPKRSSWPQEEYIHFFYNTYRYDVSFEM